jgi:hypothetical protein
MHGKVIECKPTALQKRREHRNTIALDAEQNQIRRKDIVKVMEGPHAVSIKTSVLDISEIPHTPSRVLGSGW